MGIDRTKGRAVRTIRIAVLLALVLAACGGGAGSTTTNAGTDTTTAVDEATTTAAVTETTVDDDDGPTVGLDEIPQECLDALAGFLRVIEPIVEPVDWETATIDDFEELGTAIEEETASYEEEITEAGCEEVDVDVDDDEAFQFMIDFAENEAPGTVGYLTWIRGFLGAPAGEEASGDCETDIAAVQAVVDQGGTMSELPLTEVARIGGLMGSITTACSAERASEFLSQPDVEEFLSSDG